MNPSPEILPSLDTVLAGLPGIASVRFLAEPIAFRTTGLPGAWQSGPEALHFKCALTVDRPIHHGGGRTSPWTSTIEGEYSCGTGHADAWWKANLADAVRLAPRHKSGQIFPDYAYAKNLAQHPAHRRSIDGAKAVTLLRLGFRPSAEDYLAAVLSDVQSTAGFSLWEEWAQDCGMFEGLKDSKEPANYLHRIQSAWATVKGHESTLFRLVGDKGLEALQAAREARGL